MGDEKVTLNNLQKLWEEKGKPWLIAVSQEDFDFVFDELKPEERFAYQLTLMRGVQSIVLPPLEVPFKNLSDLQILVAVSSDVEQGKPLFLH